MPMRSELQPVNSSGQDNDWVLFSLLLNNTLTKPEAHFITYKEFIRGLMMT